MRDLAQYVGEEKGGAAHSLLLVVAHEAGEGREGRRRRRKERVAAGWLAGCLPVPLQCLPVSLPSSLFPSIVLRGACSNTSIKIRIS